jgi:hypothetical protein
MKKEIPILFSTPMVQAILEGRKTQTRRIIKPQPADEPTFMPNAPLDWHDEWKPWKWETHEGESISKHCRYGELGDLLWVRESWFWEGDTSYKDIQPIGTFWYKADDKGDGFSPARWKPSIHMPKEAARIWLKITNVKAQLLQNITEEDAKAEGVETLGLYPGYDISARGKFNGLWSLINGNESWDLNPWVWVVSFKVLSTTGKP